MAANISFFYKKIIYSIN